MPMLRTIKIDAIAVSMVNPVRSLGGKSAAPRTVKVIHRDAEVAAAMMIFGNRGRHEVPSPARIGVGFVGAAIARASSGREQNCSLF
jgi:hypothetical protein